jgi:hypothetical protein
VLDPHEWIHEVLLLHGLNLNESPAMIGAEAASIRNRDERSQRQRTASVGERN